MTELISLPRTDGAFRALLQGPPPRGKQVSIVQSLNPTRANELVTFAIRDRRVSVRDYVFAVAEVLKLRLLIYVISPLLIVRLKQFRDLTAGADERYILVTLFAILFFEGTSLLIEHREHVQGIDRILGSSFQKPLQRGIFSAKTLWRWGILFLTGALVIASYLLLHLSIRGWILGSLILICALLWLNPLFRSKHNEWAEASCYLLFGPLLFVGIQIGSNVRLDFEILCMGLAFGLLSLWNFYLKNFSYIFLQEHEYFKNSIFRRGFDRSKNFLTRFWFLLVIAFCSYSYAFQSSRWISLNVVACLILSVQIFFSFRKLQSPLGSRMSSCIAFGRSASLAILFLWIFETFIWALAH